MEMTRGLLILALFASAALADEQTALITKIEKRVEVQVKGGPWVAAAADMKLSVDDQIHTGYKATATLKFADGSEVTVKPMTMIKLQRVEQNGNTVSTKLLLRLGEIKANVNDSPTLGSDFQVQTATCTASVRGTVIDSLAYSPALGTTCQMGYEGKLQLRTLVGKVLLQADQLGTAAASDSDPSSADATRQAMLATVTPGTLTATESAAADALGVPKSGTYLSSGTGAAGGAVNTSIEATADVLAVNAVNEAASGVDLNNDGIVERINAGSNIRTPPFVTIPPLPGVVSNCCPLPAVPVVANPLPVVVTP